MNRTKNCPLKETKIGYQGVEYSYNHFAAKALAKKLELSSYSLLPLTNSQNVVNALKRKEIDLGVMAVRNNNAGMVSETWNAITNEPLELICTHIQQIDHVLFKKRKDIRNEEIVEIVSHEMALKQCKSNIALIFPNANVRSCESTSLAAKYLAEGSFEDGTAIICSAEAGKHHSLINVRETFQDTLDNKTEFRIYKLRTSGFEPSMTRKILVLIFSKSYIEWLLKLVAIVIIFSGMYLKDFLNWSWFEFGTTISGSIATIFVFLTSKRLKTWVRFRAIQGYWQYVVITDDQENVDAQRYAIPRIVRIEKLQDKLGVKGWIADKSSTLFFKSTSTLLSELGEENGNFVYWYEVADPLSAKCNFKGIVTLEWNIDKPYNIINEMEGKFYSAITKNSGTVNFSRITEDEFENIKNADYLIMPFKIP